MHTPRFKLYVDAQFISPYAMSAFVALVEKDLPFELLTVDLAARQHQGTTFSGVSLTRRVPALSEGDFHLAESTAIAEYLEQIHPTPPVYPLDARQRAKARELQAWLRSDLQALRGERPTEVVFYGEGYAPLSPAGRAGADKLIAAAQALLGEDGRAHLFGQWSIADTDLALMLKRLATPGDDLPEPLLRYARAQWQRPSVQQWVRQTQAMKAASP